MSDTSEVAATTLQQGYADGYKDASIARIRADIARLQKELESLLSHKEDVSWWRDEALEEIRIEDMKLSTGATNALRRARIDTLKDVYEWSTELLQLRNFGRKSYDTLSERLVARGFPRLP